MDEHKTTLLAQAVAALHGIPPLYESIRPYFQDFGYCETDAYVFNIELNFLQFIEDARHSSPEMFAAHYAPPLASIVATHEVLRNWRAMTAGNGDGG